MVFISYSHKDESWKDRLVTHLGVLQQEGLLGLWDDRQIDAGEDWYQKIKEAMNTANVAVFMISADFLTSSFILKKEVPRLMNEKGMYIFPVLIKQCAWDEVNWLDRMQIRPKGAVPLAAGTEHEIDTNLTAIAKEINSIIKKSSLVEKNKSFDKPEELIVYFKESIIDYEGWMKDPLRHDKFEGGIYKEFNKLFQQLMAFYDEIVEANNALKKFNANNKNGGVMGYEAKKTAQKEKFNFFYGKLSPLNKQIKDIYDRIITNEEKEKKIAPLDSLERKISVCEEELQKKARMLQRRIAKCDSYETTIDQIVANVDKENLDKLRSMRILR